MEVCGALEDVAGEDSAIVWADHALVHGLVPVDPICHFVLLII